MFLCPESSTKVQLERGEQRGCFCFCCNACFLTYPNPLHSESNLTLTSLAKRHTTSIFRCSGAVAAYMLFSRLVQNKCPAVDADYPLLIRMVVSKYLLVKHWIKYVSLGDSTVTKVSCLGLGGTV